MSWFKSKAEKPTMIVPPAAASRVEVELHKGASVDAARKADVTNKHLTDLLVENGFTIKIYIAAGGRHKPKKVGNNKND